MANFLTKIFSNQPERKSPEDHGFVYRQPTNENPNHEYWRALKDFFGGREPGKLSRREIVAQELVFRCLRAKALAVQDLFPIVQQLASGNEWQQDLTHPAIRALRNPNPSNTFADLLAFMLVSEDVHAQTYLEILRSPSRGVVGLRPLQHHTVTEQPKAGAMSYGAYGAEHYRLEDIDHYQVLDNRLRRLRPDDVINLRADDIHSPLAGLSATDVAGELVGMGKALTKYARAYLEAGGPSGLLKIKNKSLTKEQADALQEKWYQRYNLLRGKQTGRVAVLDEDGDYQQIGSHLSDLDNESLRMSEQASICTALGVPGQLVGAYYAIRWGNNRAGQETAQQQFWNNTLSPTLARYRQIFDKYFLSQYEGDRAGINVRVFWDISNVKALQEDADKTADRARKNYAGDLVTRNEARLAIGLKPMPDGDKLRSQEAEERAQRQAEQAAQSGQAGQTDPANQANGQKKSLEIKRKPTRHEVRVMDAIRQAQDTAATDLATVLTAARADLLPLALAAVQSGAHLEFPAQHLASLSQIVSDTVQAGRKTVKDETGEAKAFRSVASVVGLLVSVAGSALANQVQARLRSIWLRYQLRGLTDEELRNAVEAEMRGESLSYVEELAAGVSYQAIADGRRIEHELQRRPGDKWMYSAILDANTCEECEAADLQESENLDDLPPAPNPLCHGRWRCRCQHILVRD